MGADFILDSAFCLLTSFEFLMQKATLTIDAGGADAGDTVAVLGNVDARGRATEDCDRVVAKWPVCPLAGPTAGWLEGRWLDGPWLGETAIAVIEIVTPALYFGLYRFMARVTSPSANTADSAESSVLVNSGPRMVDGFRLKSIGDDGRPIFAMRPPPQFG